MTEPVPLNQELVEILNKGGTAPKIEISGDAIQAEDLEVIRVALEATTAAQLARIATALDGKIAREKFRGEEDPRKLPVTDNEECLDLVREWPFTAWIGVFLINYGPGTVEIAVNESDWQEIMAGESRTISHADAERRIERLRYKCPPGQTASLKVEAQY